MTAQEIDYDKLYELFASAKEAIGREEAAKAALKLAQELRSDRVRAYNTFAGEANGIRFEETIVIAPYSWTGKPTAFGVLGPDSKCLDRVLCRRVTDKNRIWARSVHEVIRLDQILEVTDRKLELGRQQR